MVSRRKSTGRFVSVVMLLSVLRGGRMRRRSGTVEDLYEIRSLSVGETL